MRIKDPTPLLSGNVLFLTEALEVCHLRFNFKAEKRSLYTVQQLTSMYCFEMKKLGRNKLQVFMDLLQPCTLDTFSQYYYICLSIIR